MGRQQTKNGQPAVYNATPITLADMEAGALQVDANGYLIVSPSATTSPDKVEDSASASGDVGAFILSVRNDAQATLTNTDGDYTATTVDAAGNRTAVGNVAAGATDSGSPVKVGGKYNSSAPTLTTGQRGDLQLDAAARLLTANGASVIGGASFLNIAAGQATTTVKSGAGTLYTIVLNSAATATNTTTIYDNTAASGTVIARPAATTATVPTTLNYGPAGLAFATGLTIITATANGSDMTVIYK